MPKTKLQFQQIKDERKLSILNAALPLFAVYSNDEVTIDLISSKAKCSHGLVYHYFKNVNEVYSAIIESKNYEDFINQLFVENDELSNYEKLVQIVEKFLQFQYNSDENIAFSLLLFSNDSKGSPYRKILKLISDGQKDGDIVAGNPSEILNCLVSLLRGLYIPILIKKHPNVKIPPLENVVQIFKRRKF